ncbi:MAG TPA: carboxypeptidase regulatory-like domain-containing protein, partial [Alphaproteobacteria bacterium]|nr:carboxypeptidase regulatory-like domain-containing protein [Alphaproteobacteria bacterium]
EGWSIANAPAGTLPASVIRTNKAVVVKKALALAEAGLRIKLGESPQSALRDLLDDFYGGNPIDPGFDQLLRTTHSGQNFERAVGAALAQPVLGTGVLNFQQDLSRVFASGTDFISFGLASGSSAPPVTFSFTDGQGNVSQSLGLANFSNDVPGFAEAPLGDVDASPVLGLETAPSAYPYTLQFTGTSSGTLDLAVTMPHGDGTFVNGQISGVAITPGLKGRVVLNVTNSLVLELDTANDGTFATQKPLSSISVSAEGPTLLSANVIGPETLPGATPLGVQMALLFDRVVDSGSAQQTANYQIPQNAVEVAKAQLSGRIVVANLQQPEGTYVPTTVRVTGIVDQRGVVGPIMALPIGSQILDPGGVVSGRVFNADGTPVSTAVVTYAQIPPQANCADESNEQPVGVAAIPVNADGHYEVRFVRQDQCGSPFSMSTTDPNTGGLRQVSSFVRFPGEQILMDIALFGRGGVSGTVRDLTGNPVPGATVVVLSGTDTQIGAKTITDGSGHYSVTGITVGPVSVQAGKGSSLGHSAGNIPRANGFATID